MLFPCNVFPMPGTRSRVSNVNRGGDYDCCQSRNSPFQESAPRTGGGSGGGDPSGFGVAHQALQIGAHLRRMLVADVAVLLQRLSNDDYKVLRNGWIQTCRPDGFTIQEPVENLSGAGATKRHEVGDHLIEH